MIIRGNFCQFCIKLYVVTPHLYSFTEMVKMRGQNMVLVRNKKNYH